MLLAVSVVPGQAQPLQAFDSTGTLREVPAVPQRIACLYAFTGHTVVMLGLGDRIVAVVRGLKRDKLLARVYPPIENIAVPTHGGSINIESLLKTSPDIVFLKPETAKIESELKALDRFHLPYFVAGYQSMAEQMATIENMGKILGVSERAQHYTDYYRSVITRVQQGVQKIPQEKRLRVYHSINESFRTDAPGTLEADWTSACGVKNVSVDARLKQEGDKQFANMEQILLWNPEVIIANESAVQEEIEESPKWAQLTAVKEQRVYTIPVGISRWGHPGGLETPLAMLWTVKTLYPQYFKDLNLQKEILYFYQEFFGIVLEDAMIDQILSGKGMRQAN